MVTYDSLPDIAVLRERCRALAMVDAVLSPRLEYRHYTFDAYWGPDEQLASMANGSGDEWSIVFSTAGAFVRGFDHESAMSPAVNDYELWPGLLTGLPSDNSG
nr:hypothetical protein [Asanoa hainanensis]